MKRQDKSFEDFFRESFEGAEMQPSTQLWENISNRLDSKTDNKPAYYWWLGGIAASLLVVFVAYIALYNPFGNTQNENLAQANTVQITENQAAKNNAVADNKAILPVEKKTTDENIVSKESSVKNELLQKEIAVNSSQNSVITKNNQQLSNKETKKVADNSGNKNKIIAPIVIKTVDDKITDIAKNNIKINPTIVTIAPTDEKLYELNLLKRIDFAVIPSELQPLQMIFVTPTQQLLVLSPTKTKSGFEFTVTGFYNSFSPNFSGVKDGITPNPFVTNIDKRFGVVYDSSLFAQDLAKPTNLTSYSFAVGVNKKLYKGFGLQAGLGYTSVSYVIEHKNFFFFNPTIIQGSAPNTLYQKTGLLNIPVALTYGLQTGKVFYGLQAGIQTDVLLENSLDNKLAKSGGHVYSFGEYNTLNFNGLAGLKVGYLITPNISIHTELNYRKALNSVYDTPNLKSNPDWLGLGFGMGYRF